MESEKIIQMNLFPGKSRDAGIENRHVSTAGEGDGGTSRDSSTDIYALPCVKQTASGKLL